MPLAPRVARAIEPGGRRTARRADLHRLWWAAIDQAFLRFPLPGRPVSWRVARSPTDAHMSGGSPDRRRLAAPPTPSPPESVNASMLAPIASDTRSPFNASNGTRARSLGEDRPVATRIAPSSLRSTGRAQRCFCRGRARASKSMSGSAAHDSWSRNLAHHRSAPTGPWRWTQRGHRRTRRRGNGRHHQRKPGLRDRRFGALAGRVRGRVAASRPRRSRRGWMDEHRMVRMAPVRDREHHEARTHR